jgi:hypothetical protein
MIVPSFNLNRSEANYRRQQDTALRYLHDHAKVRPNVDMWYLMGPFYECLGRRRMGRPIDGGQHDSAACSICELVMTALSSPSCTV